MCLGIPGQIVEIIDPAQHRATVSVDGVRREVNVGLLMSGAKLRIDVGDWVLVHVGFAMEKIDEEEANRHLGYIKEMGSLFDEELESFVETRPI